MGERRGKTSLSRAGRASFGTIFSRLMISVRRCASFRAHLRKGVSIFEGISEVFQDAHFRRMVSIFEGGAHLRSRALALHPGPLRRKVAQPPASASVGLAAPGSDDAFDRAPLVSAWVPSTSNEFHACVHHQIRRRSTQLCRRRCADLAVSLPAGRARRKSPARKKSRAWIFRPGTAPLKRDLQLVAVPFVAVPYFFVR